MGPQHRNPECTTLPRPAVTGDAPIPQAKRPSGAPGRAALILVYRRKEGGDVPWHPNAPYQYKLYWKGPALCHTEGVLARA